jgi:hypothetical protein
MRATTLRLLNVLALPILAACASSGTRPPVTAAPSGPIEGNYEYLANLPSLQVRGTMRIVGDTVLVEPLTDYCRPSVAPPDPFAIKYTCTGTGTYEQIQLTIDRRNPMQLSKWHATFRVQRRREVCAQYAVRDGRQVCVQMTTETYETNETRSGNLQVRRAPTTS